MELKGKKKNQRRSGIYREEAVIGIIEKKRKREKWEGARVTDASSIPLCRYLFRESVDIFG